MRNINDYFLILTGDQEVILMVDKEMYYKALEKESVRLFGTSDLKEIDQRSFLEVMDKPMFYFIINSDAARAEEKASRVEKENKKLLKEYYDRKKK